MLTLAVLGAEGNDGSGLGRTASLVGTVPHAVAEVGLLAVALDVVLAAAELRVGDAEHVVDASALGGSRQRWFTGFCSIAPAIEVACHERVASEVNE